MTAVDPWLEEAKSMQSSSAAPAADPWLEDARSMQSNQVDYAGMRQAAQERALARKGDFQTNLNRELADEYTVSPEGLKAWAVANPEKAKAIAAVEAPSRSHFDEAGLPRRPGGDRQRIAATLREVLASSKPTPSVAASPAVAPAPAGPRRMDLSPLSPAPSPNVDWNTAAQDRVQGEGKAEWNRLDSEQRMWQGRVDASPLTKRDKAFEADRAALQAQYPELSGTQADALHQNALGTPGPWKAEVERAKAVLQPKGGVGWENTGPSADDTTERKAAWKIIELDKKADDARKRAEWLPHEVMQGIANDWDKEAAWKNAVNTGRLNEEDKTFFDAEYDRITGKGNFKDLQAKAREIASAQPAVATIKAMKVRANVSDEDWPLVAELARRQIERYGKPGKVMELLNSAAGAASSLVETGMAGVGVVTGQAGRVAEAQAIGGQVQAAGTTERSALDPMLLGNQILDLAPKMATARLIGGAGKLGQSVVWGSQGLPQTYARRVAEGLSPMEAAALSVGEHALSGAVMGYGLPAASSAQVNELALPRLQRFVKHAISGGKTIGAIELIPALANEAALALADSPEKAMDLRQAFERALQPMAKDFDKQLGIIGVLAGYGSIGKAESGATPDRRAKLEDAKAPKAPAKASEAPVDPIKQAREKDAAAAEADIQAQEAAKPAEAVAPEKPVAAKTEAPVETPPPAAEAPKYKATQDARKLAESEGVDLAGVKPADGDKITGQDVRRAMREKKAVDAPVAEAMPEKATEPVIAPEVAQDAPEAIEPNPVTKKGSKVQEVAPASVDEAMARIGDLHDDAVARPRAGKRERVIGVVGEEEARRLDPVSDGKDLKGYRHVIDDEHIRKILGDHGEGNESDPTQVPVTREDLLRIPDIISNPDTVEMGRVAKETRPGTVKYSKRFNGTVIFVEEIRTNKETLATKTMWKKKGPSGTMPTPAPESTPQPERPKSLGQEIVREGEEKVKSGEVSTTPHDYDAIRKESAAIKAKLADEDLSDADGAKLAARGKEIKAILAKEPKAAPPTMTGDEFERQAVATGRVTPEQAKATRALLDAAGSAMGEHPDSFIGRIIGTVKAGEYTDSKAAKSQADAGKPPRGSTVIDPKTGKAIVTLFAKGDVSTLAHEVMHAMEPWLPPNLQDSIRTHFGLKKGATLKLHHKEALSSLLERYLMTGKGPAGLKAVFEQFKMWMKGIYEKLTGSRAQHLRFVLDAAGEKFPVVFDARAKAIFDVMFGKKGTTIEDALSRRQAKERDSAAAKEASQLEVQIVKAWERETGNSTEQKIEGKDEVTTRFDNIGEGGQYKAEPSMHFRKAIPGEVADLLKGHPNRLNLLKIIKGNDPKGSAEDHIADNLNGDPEAFVRDAERLAGGKKGVAEEGLRRAREWAETYADHDDAAAETLAKLDRLDNLREGKGEFLLAEENAPKSDEIPFQPGLFGEALPGQPENITQKSLGIGKGERTPQGVGDVDVSPDLEKAAVAAVLKPGAEIGNPRKLVLALMDTKGWQKLFNDPSNPMPEAGEAFLRATKGKSLFQPGETDPEKVPSVKGDEIGEGGDLRELRKKAKDYAVKNFIAAGLKVWTPAVGHEVGFDNSGIRKTLQKSDAPTIQSMAALPEMLRVATLVESGPDRKSRPNIKAVHRLVAPVEVAGKRYEATIFIREKTDGTWFYDHYVNTKEPAGISGGSAPEGPQPARSTAGSYERSIAPKPENVKPENDPLMQPGDESISGMEAAKAVLSDAVDNGDFEAVKAAKAKIKALREGGQKVAVTAGTESVPSKAAEWVDAIAVEKGLHAEAGNIPLRQHEVMSMKEQAEMVAALPYDRAERIALGEEAPPPNLRTGSVFVAVANKATMDGNYDLVLRLARSKALDVGTRAGQEVKAFDAHDPLDPVTAIRHIMEAAKDHAKRTGASPEKVAELQGKLDAANKAAAEAVAKAEEAAKRAAIAEADAQLAREQAEKAKAEPKAGKARKARLTPESMRESFRGNKEVPLSAMQDALASLDAEYGVSGKEPLFQPGQAESADPRLVKIARGFIEAGRPLKDAREALAERFGEKIIPDLEAAWKEARGNPPRAESLRKIRDALKGEVKDGEKPKTLADLQQQARDLYRGVIEDGVKGVEARLDAVHEAIREIDPTITREEVRDAVSGYGKEIIPSQEPIEVELRENMAQHRELAKLRDMAETQRPPKKTGLRRDKTSDAVRGLIKDVNEAKRNLPPTAESRSNELQTTLGAIRTRLTNEIADLDRQIAAGKRDVRSKTPVEYTDELKALRDERDTRKGVLDNLDPRDKARTDADKIASAMKYYEKRMAALNEKLAGGDFTRQQKPTWRDTPDSPEKQAALSAEKAAKELSGQMRTLAGMKVSPEQAKQLVDLSRNAMQARASMEAGPRRTNGRGPTETEMAYGLAARAFEKQVAELRGSASKLTMADFKANPAEAILKLTGSSLKTMVNIGRSLKAAFDDSFFGRQGRRAMSADLEDLAGLIPRLLGAEGHAGPRFVWTRSLVKSFAWIGRTFGGKDVTDALRADVLSDPNYGRMKIGKLALGEVEEGFPVPEGMSKLADRLTSWATKSDGSPIRRAVRQVIGAPATAFSASETAFNGGAHYMRQQLFNRELALAERKGLNIDDPRLLKGIARLVNTQTARGDSKSHPVIDFVLWTPRMLLSHIDTLTLHVRDVAKPPEERMTAYARFRAAVQLAEFVGSTAGMLMLARAFGQDREKFDLTNPDSLKLKVGNTRFDPTGGVGALVTLGARIANMKYTDSTTGRVTKLNEGGFGQKNAYDVLLDFMGNKFAPLPSELVQHLKGEDRNAPRINGKPQKPTVLGSIIQQFIPLPLQTSRDLLADPDSAPFLASMIADGLGVSVSNYPGYGPKVHALNAKITEAESAGDTAKHDRMESTWTLIKESVKAAGDDQKSDKSRAARARAEEIAKAALSGGNTWGPGGLTPTTPAEAKDAFHEYYEDMAGQRQLTYAHRTSLLANGHGAAAMDDSARASVRSKYGSRFTKALTEGKADDAAAASKARTALGVPPGEQYKALAHNIKGKLAKGEIVKADADAILRAGRKAIFGK